MGPEGVNSEEGGSSRSTLNPIAIEGGLNSILNALEQLSSRTKYNNMILRNEVRPHSPLITSCNVLDVHGERPPLLVYSNFPVILLLILRLI